MIEAHNSVKNFKPAGKKTNEGTYKGFSFQFDEAGEFLFMESYGDLCISFKSNKNCLGFYQKKQNMFCRKQKTLDKYADAGTQRRVGGFLGWEPNEDIKIITLENYAKNFESMSLTQARLKDIKDALAENAQHMGINSSVVGLTEESIGFALRSQKTL